MNELVKQKIEYFSDKMKEHAETIASFQGYKFYLFCELNKLIYENISWRPAETTDPYQPVEYEYFE